MSFSADLFWSFRSPYSYLATKRYRLIEQEYDVTINVRPVFPLAIREPDFFKAVNSQWISYLLLDCKRNAEYQNLPFAFPNPDPVNMNMMTREISDDQPHIYWVTRMGVVAAQAGKGLAFIDEMSSMIWGGVAGWDSNENLNAAAKRAGLSLVELQQAMEGQDEMLDAEIAANQSSLEKAGHWGVPTLVFDGEPFFGQDRMDLALWRMEQKGLKKR